MIIKNIALATALSATVLCASAANAQTQDYYVQFNSGFAYGMKPGNDLGSKNMGNAALFGFETGYKVDENFRAGLSFDYLTGFKGKNAESEKINAELVTLNNTVKVKSYVAMLNLYYDIGEFNGFTPYMTIGAGMARNKSKLNAVQADEDGDTLASVSSKGTKNNFAYKLGLGTRYALDSSFDLDVRYQYQDLGRFKVNSSISDVSGKLRAQALMVGVIYKF